MQLFFTLVFTYPSFPQSLTLPTGLVDLEVWKNVMITLEGKTNETFAKDTYTRLVPEPAGPQVSSRPWSIERSPSHDLTHHPVT